ncbi:DNA-directed DNA polymerase B, partial [mine drainage metagenome]
GIFVEVNRKRKAGEATIHGLNGDPFDTEETELEEPGVDYCPVLAAVLTSGAHLLLALVDSVVASAGGELVYCDTDSAFVTPPKIATEVAERFEALSPYSERVPLLKDETEEKAPRKEYPVGSPDTAPRFYGLSAKRYCLFATDKQGQPHVFRKSASDHGLGVFEASGNREEFVARVWEAILSKGPDAPGLYAGTPATAPFSLSSPALLPRVRRLGPIRPFTFLTARFLEPSPDLSEDRSELVAFVPTSDETARAELMALPRQRSWGSVLEAFVRHRDRKCLFDADGRMVRRRVLVRKLKIVGLGKEANRIESGRVLGQAAVGGRAKTYVDWKRRLLSMGRGEARALRLPWDFVMRAKRRVRAGRELRRDALARVKRALVAGIQLRGSRLKGVVLPFGVVWVPKGLVSPPHRHTALY